MDLHTGDYDHKARRLRDLLRSDVFRGTYAAGLLPSEPELMSAHGVSRGTVRAALGLLRYEGLIGRKQGIGTYSQSHVELAQLAEAHGRRVAPPERVFGEEARPRILDRSVMVMPAPVAARLGSEAGERCVRIEYVGFHRDEPICVATNYVRLPEGAALLQTPFLTDWYQLLADAGLDLGASEFLLGCTSADMTIAPLLDVVEGSPLMVIEQLIGDGGGRAYNWAYIAMRGDRFLLFDRAAGLRKDGAQVPTVTKSISVSTAPTSEGSRSA